MKKTKAIQKEEQEVEVYDDMDHFHDSEFDEDEQERPTQNEEDPFS